MADPSLHYAELIGQEDALARLRAFTELFASSGTTPGHILLIGDDGMGQSTIAKTIAHEFAMARGKLLQYEALYGRSAPDGPSKKQVELCRVLNLSIPDGATRGMVSAALDAYFAGRSAKHSESEKQC